MTLLPVERLAGLLCRVGVQGPVWLWGCRRGRAPSVRAIHTSRQGSQGLTPLGLTSETDPFWGALGGLVRRQLTLGCPGSSSVHLNTPTCSWHQNGSLTSSPKAPETSHPHLRPRGGGRLCGGESLPLQGGTSFEDLQSARGMMRQRGRKQHPIAPGGLFFLWYLSSLCLPIARPPRSNSPTLCTPLLRIAAIAQGAVVAVGDVVAEVESGSRPQSGKFG